MSVFAADRKQPQLVHIAADGETYGHHHRFGEMALAYCLHRVDSAQDVRLTVYGEYLEKHPPTHEAEILENSSWSCAHGVERWKSDCGCHSGAHPEWHQRWRAPLRGALDRLRDGLAQMFEEQAGPLVKDPWSARDDYIHAILDRSPDNVERFLSKHAGRELGPDEKVRLLKLLELQRHAMLMYTSCGWFFEEISGLETVQILHYAARATQLAHEVTGIDLEPALLKALESAPGNRPQFQNGARVYESMVKPEKLDLLRVGAHFAVSSLFREHPKRARLYCYTVESDHEDRTEMGRQRLALGKARLRSDITWEESAIDFAVLHLGNHNVTGAVGPESADTPFETRSREIKDAFMASNVAKVISLMEKFYGSHNYSLWHMFKDDQRNVMSEIAAASVGDAEVLFRQIFERNYPMMQAMNEMRMPLPKPLAMTAEFVLNTDLRRILEDKELALQKLEKLAQELKRWPAELDQRALGFAASRRLDEHMKRLAKSPDDLSLMKKVIAALRVLKELPLDLTLWRPQNVYFSIGKRVYKDMAGKADSGDATAADWGKCFNDLGGLLEQKFV